MIRMSISNRFIFTMTTIILLLTLNLTVAAQQNTKTDTGKTGISTNTHYTAVSGDTPYSIAKKFGITLEALYRANPGTEEKLTSGQTLQIPTKGNQVTPTIQNDKTNASNIPYILYTAKRKETVYSIAKKHNTTQEVLLKANPNITEGLKKGDILRIPNPTVIPVSHEKKKKNDENEKNDLHYTVVSGDNYFQLEKRFGVTEQELERLNPELKDGIKSGMTIRIPIKTSENQQVPKETISKTEPYFTKPKLAVNEINKTYQIGIFLPFCQSQSDSTKIAQRTSAYLEFYSGILLASNKLTQAGMKLKLFVYDTNMDNRVISQLVKKPEFLSFDLIIGPVYPENQKIVAELSSKNNIPMISPLSSGSQYITTTPGYYQINPDKKSRVIGTAEYLAEKYPKQNIIVLNHGTNSRDESTIYERLVKRPGAARVHYYNIWENGTSELTNQLNDDDDNIIVLAEQQEAKVSIAITRLNTLSKSHKIKVFGLQEYTKIKSIDTESLHNINLHYLAPYFINYNEVRINSFIENYRTIYKDEPTPYSFQGYDIAFHFFSLLKKSGKGFPNEPQQSANDLLQADYSFQKVSPLGGFMNQSLQIIEYTRDYEVKSISKFIPSRLTNQEKESASQMKTSGQ